MISENTNQEIKITGSANQEASAERKPLLMSFVTIAVSQIPAMLADALQRRVPAA
jgi:hypothetical protein